MNLLKSVSSSKELPFLNRWLHKAHENLSYPKALEQSKAYSFSTDALQELVSKVWQVSKEMEEKDGWCDIIEGKKISREKRMKQRKKLIEENERLRIYPEISSALKILKNGLSIPKNNYF